MPAACLFGPAARRRTLSARHRNIFEAIRNQAGSGEPAFTPFGIDSEPVAWWPGSPEKIEAIRRRLEAGLELWHPRDRHGLDKHTHRQMFRDMANTTCDERELAVWVAIDGEIVFYTDNLVTIKKKRFGGKGNKQLRLKREHVTRYRYDLGEKNTALHGVKLQAILIPRWLAEARNLVEI